MLVAQPRVKLKWQSQLENCNLIVQQISHKLKVWAPLCLSLLPYSHRASSHLRGLTPGHAASAHAASLAPNTGGHGSPCPWSGVGRAGLGAKADIDCVPGEGIGGLTPTHAPTLGRTGHMNLCSSCWATWLCFCIHRARRAVQVPEPRVASGMWAAGVHMSAEDAAWGQEQGEPRAQAQSWTAPTPPP